MDTGSSVSTVHPPIRKDFPTLIAWEFLTPVDPHMDHKMVVGLEGLLTHWTVLSFPGNSWNLVGDLSNLPGLSTPRKGPPQQRRADTYYLTCFNALFFTSTLSPDGWGWGVGTSAQAAAPAEVGPKTVSGYPRFRFLTSCLILTRQPNSWILLSV